MAEFRFTGPVWLVRLDNNEAETVSAVLAVLGPPISVITGPLAIIVVAAVEASAAYITLMNKLGGNQGVDIHGVAGSRGVIVTPRVSGMYEKLMEGASVGVAAGTIGEFLLKAAAAQPALSASLGLSTAASIFSHVAGGTPLGWAIAGAFGALIDVLLSEPDPDQHGGVLADRDHIGPWEAFIMSHLGQDNTVALLSWQGFFSARDGGGGAVYANRPWVQSWERWKLIDNNDGTVSFRTDNGHFLVAEEGGGRECRANRTAIGTWEKFYIENLPGGQIALRTRDKWKYVSVQGIPTTSPATLAFSNRNQQHIFYRGTDGAINHIFYDQPTNKLYHDQWTARTYAPPAAGDPATLVFANPNQQHVFYLGTDGAINHIFYDQSTNKLYHDQWTARTNAPPAAGDPATLVFANPNQQHVFYRGTDGAINHIFYDQSTNKLYHDRWTARLSAPPVAGSLATMVTD